MVPSLSILIPYLNWLEAISVYKFRLSYYLQSSPSAWSVLSNDLNLKTENASCQLKSLICQSHWWKIPFKYIVLKESEKKNSTSWLLLQVHFPIFLEQIWAQKFHHFFLTPDSKQTVVDTIALHLGAACNRFFFCLFFTCNWQKIR